MTDSESTDRSLSRTLYVVIQDLDGRVGHRRIGPAVVEADLDASLTNLALRRRGEFLATFVGYSRQQAAEAIRELEELGDVEVDPRDFDQRWFDPVDGIAAVDTVLRSRSRSVTPAVRTDLELLRRVLQEIASRGWRFHLLEVTSKQEIGCSELRLADGEHSIMGKEAVEPFYSCDCGHRSDFFESTIREMKAKSMHKRTVLGDGDHSLVFRRGEMTEILCPRRKPQG